MADDVLHFDASFSACTALDGGDSLILKFERNRWHVQIDRQRDGQSVSLGETEIEWVLERYHEIVRARDAANLAFSASMHPAEAPTRNQEENAR